MNFSLHKFQDLINWYLQEKRILPWRQSFNPYHIWISEIMLQQTQVITVIDYFNRFVAAFPSIIDLANANQQQVLKLWEGLGYYSRARNLHNAAQYLVKNNNQKLPQEFEELKKIPGIGPYTAAAIASIAFQKAIPVVDGNVLRVVTRLYGIAKDISSNQTKNIIFDLLSKEIPKFNPSDFNQALMELGALICTPRNPNCLQCPFQSNCFAYQNQEINSLPVKKKKERPPHYFISIAIIFNHKDEILISKRQENQMLGGLWEFPGGKQEDKESASEAAIREVKEETNLDIQIEELITTIKHAYTHFSITLSAFRCHVLKSEIFTSTNTSMHWEKIENLHLYPFPKANKKIIDYILSQNKK